MAVPLVAGIAGVAARVIVTRMVHLGIRRMMRSGGTNKLRHIPVALRVIGNDKKAIATNRRIKERAILWASVAAQNSTAFWLRGGGKLGQGQLEKQWRKNMKVRAQRYPAVLLRVKKASMKDPEARVFSNVAKRWADTIVGQQKRGAIRKGGRGLTPELSGGVFVPFRSVPRTATGRISKTTVRNAIVTANRSGRRYVIDTKKKQVLGTFHSSIRIPKRYRINIPYRKAQRYYKKELLRQHKLEMRRIAARSNR